MQDVMKKIPDDEDMSVGGEITTIAVNETPLINNIFDRTNRNVKQRESMVLKLDSA